MKSIKFITLGSRNSGMGHIVRTWNLAQVLIRNGIKVGFETPLGTAGHEWLRDRIPTTRIGLNDEYHYQNCIIDLENGPSRELLEECRGEFKKVIVLGGVGFPMIDQAAIDELVDLQIYQSIVVTNKYSSRNYLSGVEYLILNPGYASQHEFSDVFVRERENALVIMGGADPHGITPIVCDHLLSSFNGYRPTVKAVFGSAACATNIQKIPSEVRVEYALNNLIDLFLSSKFAITALGMTTYEAACLGVPTASICWSEDHEITARALEEKGVTVNLGLWNNPDWGKMGTFVDKMHNQAAWLKMSEAGKRLVDGKGVARVTQRILEII